MRAGHVRLAGRSRVQLRQLLDPAHSSAFPELGKGASGWGWAEVPEGTDKGNSVSSPRPQSSTELSIPPPSLFQTPGFPHARFHGLPGRQTAGPTNGRTQSVNFVFARHSQPVGAGFSQVPPSVSGAPYWPHTVGRRLPPSCMWQRSRLRTRLRPFQTVFSQNKLPSSTAN